MITAPIKGGKKEGALGVVKGIQRGIFGLAMKPAAGAVDFATQTIGGIVSQAKSAAAGHAPTVVVNRRYTLCPRPPQLVL